MDPVDIFNEYRTSHSMNRFHAQMEVYRGERLYKIIAKWGSHDNEHINYMERWQKNR